MDGLLHDIRYALRQFVRAPGFAFTAVLSLVLGIGATSAIFSVIHGVLIDPYPYKDADRMVHVELRDKHDRGPLLMVNGSEYQDLRKVSFIDDVFLQQQKQAVLTGDHFPISVFAGQFSPNLFTFQGVLPLLGPEFTPADAPEGKPSPVVVLSYLFWKRQFGGNKEVLGKTIELDHKPYTIVGVVPPLFTWGDVASASISPTWLPPFGGFNAKIEVRREPALSNAETMLGLVSPQEFTTLHIPLAATVDPAVALRYE